MPTKFRLQLQPEIVVIAVALLAVAGAGIAMFGWQPDSGTMEPISAMNSPLASQGNARARLDLVNCSKRSS